MIPEAVKPELCAHLIRDRDQHQPYRARGLGHAPLPEGLDRRFPAPSQEFCWQFVFASATLCIDPKTGQRVRWHLHESAVSRTFRAAVQRSGMAQRIACGIRLPRTCWGWA
jgi:hypothetical protein